MTDALESFLAGDRPDDVVLFLSDRVVDDPEPLLTYGEAVDGGVVLVMDGETGRSVFKRATEMDAMGFAGRAMGTEGEIARDLTDATCPKRSDGETPPPGEHEPRFVLAFAEAENPEVGGRYAEGDVIHAYAHCRCGAAFSAKWVVGERADG